MSDYFLSTYYVTVTTIVHFLVLCIFYCPPSFPNPFLLSIKSTSIEHLLCKCNSK